MNIILGETIGTMLLILLGDGVVANALLSKSKGQGGGGGGAWIMITTAWALAVFVGVFAAAPVSGAHLNPAVTIGLVVAGITPAALMPQYFIGEFLGAFIGATLVWLMYMPHWAETEDKGLKLACFCTGPAIRNTMTNLMGEIIGTFVLMFGIFCIKGASMDMGNGVVSISMGALGIIPVAFLVWGIGLSLGGPTGYAINPARDLGPRIMHFILPIAGKGDSDWGYSWIPVVGPVIGAVIAALLFMAVKPFGF